MSQYNKKAIVKTHLEPMVKASVSRILSDLVKSDSVISLAELNTLDEWFGIFGVSEEDRTRGFGITLQDAFEEMKKCPVSLKNSVEEAMRSIAGADNECCRAEAMLVTAFRYAVKGSGARVYSMRFRNRPILDHQILYIENPSSRDRRIGGDLLRDCHEQLSTIVEAAGFELVYIPEIRKRLINWDDAKGKGNLERVFRIISPTLARDETVTVAERAKGLTTKVFYEDVLCSQNGLAMPLEVSKPTWMVRLCNSTLNGKGYANFLCMDLLFDKDSREERDAQIRLQMHRFIDDLNALQGSYSIVVNRHKELGEDFQYGGFYKVLFDVLLGKKMGTWELHICPGRAPKEFFDGEKNRRSQFYIIEEGRKSWIPLTGMDAALFVLVILMSIEGRNGLNQYGSRMQALFESVYLSMTTKDTECAPDITAPATFRQVKHRMNKFLSLVRETESHGMQIEQNGAVMTVRIDPSNIRVGQDTPLLESGLYRSFLRALKA